MGPFGNNLSFDTLGGSSMGDPLDPYRQHLQQTYADPVMSEAQQKVDGFVTSVRQKERQHFGGAAGGMQQSPMGPGSMQQAQLAMQQPALPSGPNPNDPFDGMRGFGVGPQLGPSINDGFAESRAASLSQMPAGYTGGRNMAALSASPSNSVNQQQAQLARELGSPSVGPAQSSVFSSPADGPNSPFSGLYGIGLGGNRGFRDGGYVSGEPTAYDELIGVYASQYGLDPLLFRNLIRQESGFDPVAVSSRGAQGLGQVMPATAQDPGYGVQPLAAEDLMDPAENLRFSAEYLSAMMREFDGDERLAVAAYNAGPGAVREYGDVPPFEETQNYVRNILGSPGTRPERSVRPVARPEREEQAESKSPMDSLSSALSYMDLAGVGQPFKVARVEEPGIRRPPASQRRDPLKQLGIASLA